MFNVVDIRDHKVFNRFPVLLGVTRLRAGKILKNSYLQKISVKLLFHLPRPF